MKMISRAAFALTIVASLLLEACGGGHGSATTPVVPQPGSAAPNAGGVSFAVQSGSVQLPSGSKIAASTLTVQNSFDTETVSSSGSFSLYADAAGPQLAVVTDANGNPMMMGFLGASEPQISAHTTAEVLVYYGAGLFTFPSPLNQQAYSSIATTPGFSNVEAAVSAALAQNPDAFSAANSPNNAVASALSTFLTSLYTPLSVARTTPARSTSSSRTLTSILVDPSNGQSGVTVLNQSPVQIAFMNTYRRMSQAFIDQVSYGVNNGQNTSIQAAPVTDVIPPITIPPTTGLSTTNSTIISTFGNNTAYLPKTTAAITLPPAANSLWTRYQVTVVGPGVSPGALSSLTPEQLAAQQTVTMQFVIYCVFLPAITGLIVPYAANASTDTFLDPTTLTSDQAKALNDLIKTLTSTAPSIVTAVNSGDIGSAYLQAWTAVVGSSTLRTQVVNFIVNNLAFKQGVGNLSVNQMANAEALGAQIMNGTKLADATLTSFDLSQVGSAWALSDMADVYTVYSVPTPILLTPATATVANGLSVTPSYVVNVPSASGSNLSLTYSWQNTANFGHFCDVSGNPSHCDNVANPFTSTVNQGVYTANATGQGTDTITVTVNALDSSGNKIENIPLGSATAAVAVASPSPTPAPLLGTPPPEPESRCAPMTVSPHVVALGGTITATVQDQGPLACGGDIPGGVPPSWTWYGTGLQTVTSGCTTSSDSCVLTARATTTDQTNTGGYASLCLNGSSTQGPWTSCDYYAVTTTGTSSKARSAK